MDESSAALESLIDVWGIKGEDAAAIFGVSERVVLGWRRTGVPKSHRPALADLAMAVDVLERHVKRDRIPAVVRRPVSEEDSRSLLNLAMSGEHAAVRELVISMVDLRRVQP